MNFTEQQPETFTIPRRSKTPAVKPSFAFEDVQPTDINEELENLETRKDAVRQGFPVAGDVRERVAPELDGIAERAETAFTEGEVSALEREVEEVKEQVREMERMRGPKGRQGERGPKGERGARGPKGDTGLKWVLGKNGRDGKDGKDGKDGAEITPEEVKKKLISLEVKDRWFDWGHLKNIPGEIFRKNADGLISWGGTTLRVNGTAADSQTILDLTQGTGITITDSGSGVITFATTITQYTDEMAQDAVGNSVGNGLDYNDVTGAISVDETELTTLVPYTGATADLDLGTWDLLTDTVGASTSAGVLIESQNQTQVGLLGAGNTANVVWYGLHNFSLATQDTIAIFTGVGKTLGSAALATYPSLMELSHVKGVTSAIQTQLDAKLDDSQATAFGLSLLDDAAASNARTTLGLGTIATEAEANYALLAGRSGGQTLKGSTTGGNNLVLQAGNSTGNVVIGNATGERVQIGDQSIAASQGILLGSNFINNSANIRPLRFSPIGESTGSGIGMISYAPTMRPGAAQVNAFGIISTLTIDRASADSTSYAITDLFNFFARTDLSVNYSSTITGLYNFHIADATNAGSGAITNQVGLNIADLTRGATTNRGIQSAVSSGSGKHNLYISGTADNYINGNVGIGTSTFGTSAVTVLGIANGTAPTTSPADMIQIWAQDTIAGQSNLYGRNENGKSEQITGLADRVSTQFDKTSDTTLANITGLSHNVEAGKAYAFEAILFTTSNAAGGVKFAIAGTATATSVIYDTVAWAGGGFLGIGTSRATALGTAVGDLTAVTAATVCIKGTIVVNAAGTLTAQFAQNASNGTASSVLVGSTFILKPIGD